MPLSKRKANVKAEPVNTYVYEDEGHDQLFYDKAAFADRLPFDWAGITRFELFKRIAEQLIPNYFEWHDWTVKLVNAMCENKWVAFPGCSNSCKTHNVAGFAAVWWMCHPRESSVLFCSTTIKMLRKRGWANIQMAYSAMNPKYGNFVDSRMLWQASKGDDKHAIFGIAVQEGNVSKAAEDIKGLHTKRQMVVIDEAEGVAPAIFEACGNLYSYPEDFILTQLANPRSWLSDFGRFSEPLNGIKSVSIDDDEWETVPKLDGKPGICIRFDAEKSPNIVEGRLVSRHLPRKEKVEAARVNLGGINAPSYWSNFRGFWPPEGLSKAVFTESALLKFHAFDSFSFTGKNYRIIGVFDPAFGGGDRPTLRFAKLGEATIGDKLFPSAILAMPPKILPLDATSTNPIHYQLVEQVRRECEAIDCAPECLGVDATGEGGGLCDILARTWSPKIIRIEFGGKPSAEPVSHEDCRLCCDVYLNKVTEMWFKARMAVDAEQLKGIDRETAQELVTRDFDDSKVKIKLVSKVDYKKQFSKSPDLGDSIAMLPEVAKRFGFSLALVGETVHKWDDWKVQKQAADTLFEKEYEAEEMGGEAIL
jgi:hypothetical protein